MTSPEVTIQHRKVALEMRRETFRGWYLGTRETAEAFIARRIVRSRLNPELAISLSFSRDKMHHSVGWWKNAEYEYCWHLSIAAKVWEAVSDDAWARFAFEPFPRNELRYWAHTFFPLDFEKLWQEPGGTDPRLTPEEARVHATMWHFRVFLHPTILNAQGEPFHEFIPKGEVYTLTRWIDGLTPEKVDR